MSYIHPHWHLAKLHQLSPLPLRPAKSVPMLLDQVADWFGALPDHQHGTTLDELQPLSQQIAKNLQEPVIARLKGSPRQQMDRRDAIDLVLNYETQGNAQNCFCRAHGAAGPLSDSDNCKKNIIEEILTCILGWRCNIVILSMNHIGLHKVANHTSLHKFANRRCFVYGIGPNLCGNSHSHKGQNLFYMIYRAYLNGNARHDAVMAKTIPGVSIFVTVNRSFPAPSRKRV